MSIAQWNALDWLLVGVLLFSVFAGFRRGLVRTVLGLAGYVCGFMLASWKYVQVADVITGYGWIKSPAMARVAAYLLIVALAVMAVELIARIAHQTVRAVGLSFVDRLLGAGFGLLRGGIAAMALLMIPAAFTPSSRVVTTSVLCPCFFAVAHDVSFLVPQYLQHLTFGAASSTKKYTEWMKWG
jgi:membrane protein required for colicin V production